MAEHETHEEVVKLARRELEDHERINCWFRPEFVRALIDRLEAAHKREAAFHAMTCEANDRLREHLQIALDANKRERGDCAKLREALEAIDKNTDLLDIAENIAPELHPSHSFVAVQIRKIVRAALAEPARNCDRPECATTKAAQEVWRKEDGGKTAYYEWLLATATEKEGGKDEQK